MEAYLPLILQLIAGVVGGNAAGAAMKERSLGTLGNSIAGLVGGGVLGQIIQALMAGGGGEALAGIDVGTVLRDVIGGGAGGAILTAIIAVLKNQLAAR